jgi:SAM-dependent methyltransferase
MAAHDEAGFWDRAAARAVFTHPLDGARLAGRVMRDAPILDYGCGHGRLCGELSALGFTDVQGVDASEAMVQVARARHPEVRFAVVDGTTLPHPDASFGAVLLVAVLTCIPSDAAQRRLIAELSRVLRPGGLLVISDYPLQTDERNLARYRTHADAFGHGVFPVAGGGVMRHHRDEWFAELLAGFAVEETVRIAGRTMNGNPAQLLQIWARLPGRAGHRTRCTGA